MASPTAPSKRVLLGVQLSEGVDRKHLMAVYGAAFATIMLGSLVNMLQPFLLDTFLGLEITEQGGATGSLGLVNEIVIVALVGTWGVLSDRWGRRPVWSVGFLIMAAGFAAMPLGRTLAALLGLRALYAVGIAACVAMLATVVADYVRDEDRGKANAMVGVMSGLGAMVSALAIVKLPGLLTGTLEGGGEAAGWVTYVFAAGLSAVAAVLVWRGLQPRQPGAAAERESFVEMARHGARAARDPGVAVSYLASFVARPDLAVAAILIPLWLSKHHVGQLAAGFSDAERAVAVARGIAEGGALIGIIGGAGLVFAPVIGILSDRINRSVAVAIALVLNAVGYGMTIFVVDPTGGLMKLAAVFIGFGQVSGAITSQVLIQQQAPVRIRGSVIGVFGTCGGLGIMFATWAGGLLFDGWIEQGPFALLAAMNAVVAVLAVALRGYIVAPAARSTVAAPDTSAQDGPAAPTSEELAASAASAAWSELTPLPPARVVD